MRIWIAIIPTLLIAHLPSTSLLGPTGYGLAQMWEVSATQSIWLQASFIVAYAARIPIGQFAKQIASDRFVFLVGFTVATIASGLFYAFADNFALAIILRLISGAAVGAMIIPALNMVTENSRAASSIGLGIVMLVAWSLSVYVSQIAGTVNVSALGSMFPPGGGWNTIYLLTAIIGFAWWVPVYFLVPKPAKPETAQQ